MKSYRMQKQPEIRIYGIEYATKNLTNPKIDLLNKSMYF